MHVPWLEELKVAIIEEHHDNISALLGEIPDTLSQDEAIEANNIIQETIKTFSSKKRSVQETMEKIKKNAAFLSQEKKKPRLSTLS